MLEERTRNVKVEIVVGTGHIQIKRVTEILRDGVVIAESVSRKVLEPGDPAGELNGLESIKNIVWTAEVLAAHAARKAAANPPPPPINPPGPPENPGNGNGPPV